MGQGTSGRRGNSNSYQSKSKNAQAIIVQINGTTLTYRNNGSVITDITGNDVLETGGLSFEQVVDRISNNKNAKVEYLNSQQVKTYDERRKHNQKIEDEYRNYLYGMYQGGVLHRKNGRVQKTKNTKITFEQYVKQHNYKYYDKLYD